MLERQRDQVAEATPRHRVLTGEQAIVGIHAQLVTPRHGLGDEIAAHLASHARRHGRREEEPDVGAVAGARFLHRGGQADAPARLDERAHVVRPGALVEVGREEPAGLVIEEWVHAHHVAAGQVPDDCGVVERDEGLVRALAALDLWQLADALDELVPAGRSVAGLSRLLAHEPRREDLFSPTKHSPGSGARIARNPCPRRFQLRQSRHGAAGGRAAREDDLPAVASCGCGSDDARNLRGIHTFFGDARDAGVLSGEHASLGRVPPPLEHAGVGLARVRKGLPFPVLDRASPHSYFPINGSYISTVRIDGALGELMPPV